MNKVDAMSYIDWMHTKAYSLQEWGIRINLKGREPHGMHEYQKLRDEIIRNIVRFKDTDSNRYVIKEALKREDVCSGDELENAPDIFLVTEDPPGYELTSALTQKDVFGPMKWKTGEHSLFSTCCMAGEGIDKGSIWKISLLLTLFLLYYTRLICIDDILFLVET